MNIVPAVTRLGDLLEVQNGYAFDSKRFSPTSGTPLIRIRDLRGGSSTETRYDGDFDPKYLVHAGDLLIGMDGEFACYRWTGAPALLNQRVCRLQDFTTDLLPRYLFYGINQHLKEIEDATGYATVKHLSSKTVLDIKMPIPPLARQLRIVGILDEAFAAIAAARANTEQNLRNARELVGAATESLFPAVIVGHPGARRLAELCDLIVDCEHKTAPTQDRGIPSIRTPNIGKGRLILDGVNRVSDDTYKVWTRRVEPRAGDLILAREAPAGNVAVIPDGLKVCLGQRTVLLRPNRSVFEPAYLAHLLLQRDSQRRLLAGQRGATVQHVNVQDIRAFRVSGVPSLMVQQGVVQKIDGLLEEGDALEAGFRQKLDALDSLKQSLLHQAFTGAL